MDGSDRFRVDPLASSRLQLDFFRVIFCKTALTVAKHRSNFPLLICQGPTAIGCFAYLSCRTITVALRFGPDTNPNSMRFSTGRIKLSRQA